MNQIFRVIWSQATQTWVAVSELTKAHKKQSATSTAQESAVKFLGQFFKLSTLTFAMLGATQAYAASAITGATVNNQVPNTDPADLLKGITLSNASGMNNIPVKLDNGTQLTYIGGDGTSKNVVAVGNVGTDGKTITYGQDSNAPWTSAWGKLSGDSTTTTSADVANALNAIRTYYVSINSNGGTNQYGTGAKTYTEATDAIAIGKNAVATDTASIAIGLGAKNERVVEKGQTTVANPSELQRATNAVSIGTNSLTTYSGAIALGSNAQARGESSIVIGQNANTFSPWNSSTGKYDQAFRSILIGYNTQAANTNGIGIGTRSQTWSNDGIVIGRDSIVNHPDSIVIGREAKSKGGLSQGIGTVTIGQGASAGSADNNRSSVAIGKQAYTGATQGFAANTYTKDSTGVLDSNSKNTVDGATMSYNSTAIGSNAGTGYNIVDIVTTATTDSAKNSVAAGTVVKRHIKRDAQGNPIDVEFYTTMSDDGKGNVIYNTVDARKVASGYAGNMATSLDTNETVLKKSGFNTASGGLSYQETNASKGTTTTGTAYLKTSGSATNDQTALGAESRAIGDSSVAIGARTIAGRSAVVIGSTAREYGNNAWNAEDRRADANAINNSYANLAALGARNDLNLAVNASSSGSALQRYQALTGRNLGATWQKTDAPYGVDGSIVLGSASHSSAALGIAQGVNSSVMKGAIGGVAIGAGATVDANSAGAMALGMGSAVNVEALGGLAIGTGATVTGRGTTPIAPTLTDRGTNAIAIGTKATADVANSVALGSGSTTVGNKATAEETGTLTKDIGNGVTETLTYGDFFGMPGVGTATEEAKTAAPGYMISVGDASTNTYRQIKNVAAGKVSDKSTDAINGSQLFAVAKFVADGWKVTGNDTATTVETVQPNERVSFVNGLGTTSSVVANADGGADVTFNVVKGDITANENNGSISYTKPDTTTYETALANAKTAAADAQKKFDAANALYKAAPTANNKTALENASKALTAANAAVNTAQNNLNNAGNQFATAENVANAISKSGFNLKATADTANGGALATGSLTDAEVINPGDTVEMVAGKNLTVKKEADGKITYATADDVNFSTVQIGGNTGPKLSADGNNLKISGPNNAAAKITNVAPGDISNTSTDAINGSQFYGLASNTITLKGQNGTAEATSTTAQALNKTGGLAFTVKSSDGTLLDVAAAGDMITLTPKTASLTTNDGVPSATTTNGKLVTADDLVNTLTNMGWKATSDVEGTGARVDSTTASEELIKAGEKVTFKAGDNLKIKQDGKNFTYSLNPALKNLTSAEFKDAAGNTFNISPTGLTITKPADTANNTPANTVTLNQNGLNNGGNTITNVAGNLPNTQNNTSTTAGQNTATGSQAAPTTVNNNNAATVGDVLNAGWNLQGNGSAVDFVKPYDTVNFRDGGNTTITTETDGTTSHIQVNVTGLPIANTVTGTDGKQTPLVKVGDNYYPAKADGTPDIQTDSAGNPTNGYVLADDGKYYPAGDVEYGKEGDKTTIKPKANKAPVTVNTNLVNPNAPKGGDQVNTATQLGNVANGANTFDAVDNTGAPLKQAANGNYYPADKVNADGSLVDGTTDSDIKSPIKLANDGKWYPANEIGANGAPNTGATAVTKPANIGTTGLIDFANSNPNNAATVGDLQNMGWVVSSDKTTGNLGTAYSDQVRNANEVRFVGTNLATVSGTTDEKGVRIITVDVDAQKTVETAQNPVVYTDNQGNKLTKVGDNFYPADSVVNNGNVYPAGSVVIDGNVYPEGTVKNEAGKYVNAAGDEVAPVTTTVKPVDKGNITASMNSGNNKTEPTKLSNVGSNLKQVVDPTIGADGKPVDGTASVNNPNGTKADGSQATNAAPTTATEAAKMLQPYELNEDGTVKNDADGNPVRNANYIGNNAATVSDVLNAGWNLQNNGEARDFVKPYDTVNFVNGGNTVAVVTTAADGTTSDVTFNVTGLPIATTTQDANGNNIQLVKVGDNYYPVNADGTPNIQKDAAGNPTNGYVKANDGNYYPAGDVTYTTDTAGNTTIAPKTDAKPTTFANNLVNPNAENTDTAPNNQVNNATQLGNVANGANTFDVVDSTGAPLKQANDGNYYPADKVKADGSLVDGTTTADAKTPLKLANDGKWYPASQVAANGAPTTGATAVTPSNVGKAGLIDFTNSNPNNAATVGDLQNMGWVVSSDKTTGNLGTAYSDQVRNANEVRFIGTNLATVSGTTDEKGVRIITVDVDAQKTVETAQNPVVYTDNQGNKLTKVGDNFYKPEDVKNAVVNGGKAYPAGSVVIDGNVYPEGTTKNEAGKYVNNAGEEVKPVTEITPVKSGDIIASMNNGDNKTEPTKLANVGSNLKQVVDPTTNADGSARKGTVNNPDGTQAKDGDNNDVTATNTAPISAKDAANLLQPYELNADGSIKKDDAGNPVRNANYIGNNAATVSDVLNAGWNLQNNGEARDFVKPYDTVNFVNGGNTVAVVTTAADGTTSDVTFNVTGLPIATTTQDANGNNVQLVKVGDNYYPVNADGTPNIQKDAAGNPTNGYVKADDGNYYPAGDVTFGKDEKGNPTITKNDNAKPTTFANNLVNPNVANTNAAPNNQVNNATQLGNVANGANTFDVVDSTGAPLKQANDGNYYPADKVKADGSLVDGTTTADAKTPLKLANDGKWYPASEIGANGAPTTGATAVTKPANIGKAGLIDFTNSNPNNAATVGDLQNMGWVVSSDKTTNGTGAYNDQVRNANEVKFVGINGAIVSGQTVDGVRTITVSMDTAGITNNPNGSAISDAQKAADDAKSAVENANKALEEANKTGDQAAITKAQDDLKKANETLDNANKAVTEAGNKLVTANTVTNAINNSGWNLQNNGAQKDLVKPSDIVNFVNGGNTVANVTTAEDGKLSDVTFNVVGLPIANTVTGTDGKQVPLVKVGDNYYPANTDGTPNITKDAAGNPTNGYVLADDGKYYPAGDVDFGTKDGKATITPKADKAPVTVNTNLVNPNAPKGGDQVNNATQLGNVANGANTFEAPKDAEGNTLVKANDGNWYKQDNVNPNGTVKTDPNNDNKPFKPATPVENSNPSAGLIDFANSNPNNAATVGDLQNMGWVVSTKDGNGYNDQVRNNNKVDFKGEGLATVTGKTLGDGTRQITVSVKTGEVVPTDKDQNSGKATIKDKDGKDQTIDVVKASDGNWYPADQVTRTTDTNGNTVINPNQGATAIAQNNVTVPNAGSGLVTGNQVGDAIQQSGWNVGLADKAKADEAFGDSSKALSADKLEKVNPDDNVRFADGKGTKVSAATVEEINKDGKKVTNTYVKVDIDAGEVKANDNGSVSGPVTKEISDNLTKANDDLAKANQAVTDADNNVAKAQKAIDDATSAGQPISADLQKALDDAKAAQTTAQAGRTTAQNAQSAAQNAFNNAGNQVATAQNVADAINNSGFNLKTSGNKVPGTQDNGELIKPSNTVEMIAGKNLTVKQDTNGKVTYETANDVQFNSVQFGDNNGPKITNNGSALNVNGAKIDGVADGDISPNSKEAVNGGQIYALTRGDVPNTTNITTTVTNPDGSTTTKTYENVISDKDGKPILTTYNVYGQTEVITNSTLTAIRNMNEQGIKFFHTNDAEAKPIVEDQNKIDSSAAGSYATAVGFQAKANGTNAVAMGKGSQALAENTIAIGTGNIVSATKSGAFGDPNYIDGKEVDGVATVSGSYAFGNDNVINSSNTFVLGNNVNNKGTTTNGRPDAMGTTVENSVYLGNQTTATAGDGSRTGTLRNLDVNGNQGATTTAGSTGTVSQAVVGNLTYGGFAGAKANGVVSVGAAGSERRIQNVAAGEISATSTDAINGSQLYSVARGVSNLAGQVNKMGKRMDANAAAAMAAANLLQAYREGQSAVTAGVGQHRGQAAVAVGYSRLSDSGKIGIKFSLSADTQGEVSTGAGIGYFW